MTYALIIVEKLNHTHGWPDSMHHVLTNMQLPEGVTRLNESAWLINLDSCLLFLSGLVKIVHTEKLSHHVTFFDQKPSFVCAPQ